MPSGNPNSKVTFSLDPVVDELISELGARRNLYRSQIVELAVLYLAEVEECHAS